MKGYLCILMAAILWGMIGPFSKLAFQEGMAPLEVAFFRAILAWFLFAAHAARRRELVIEKRDYPMVLLFAVMGVTVFYVSYQLAVNRGGAALASVLLYTAPAWVAVMSRFFFKERFSIMKLIALFSTIIGVALISLGAGSGEIRIGAPALFFGLTAGFAYSLYYILGKHFSSRYNSPTLFLYILPLGALFMVPWVEFTDKTATAWMSLLFISVLSTYGAYYFYYLGLKYLEATRAVITATLEPVTAAVVAYLWWGEYFKPSGYMGAALILAGVLIMVLEKPAQMEEQST